VLVVDTSVWIDFLNGYRSVESEYLAACLADDVPVVLPGLVLAEILAGLRTEAEAVRIGSLLAALDAAPEPSVEDYRAAAAIYRSCRRAGRAVGAIADCLIAQTCLRNDYVLLTRDRDFVRISAATGLRLATRN
jgi:predicted nucleic acid-binding protein